MKEFIFKTNITKLKAAMTIANIIPHYIKGAKVEFDAAQRYFMLNIRAPKLSAQKVVDSMKSLGYKFEPITI